jgi:hypothetical protein
MDGARLIILEAVRRQRYFFLSRSNGTPGGKTAFLSNPDEVIIAL